MNHLADQGGWLGFWARLRQWIAAAPNWLSSNWVADASRRALFAPVLIGCGIAIYFAVSSEPPSWTVYLPLPAFLIWWVCRRFDWERAQLATAAVALLIAGFSLAQWRAHTRDNVSFEKETRFVTLIGRIWSIDKSNAGQVRIILDVETIIPDPGKSHFRLRATIRAPSERLHAGDWIKLRTTIKPLPAPVAPGAFDFGRKLWFDGVSGTAFTLSPVQRVAAPRPDNWAEYFQRRISITRTSVNDRILQATSERFGPIAAAFLTGERSLISDEDNQAMQDSSLAHLLSISGLHMVLAGFGFFAAMRLVLTLWPTARDRLPVKKYAAVAALIASFAYLLLSGASVPTQRAFVMVAIAFIAIMTDRSALTMRTVAIAALAILVATPESWMDASFQMSFAAVIALIAAYEYWQTRRLNAEMNTSWFGRAWNILLASAITSMIAGLATAPFAAFHFHRFSDYGIPANVMVMPIVSFVIMPAGVLALLLMPIGLEFLPLAAMEWGIDLMMQVAHWVASWPGATQAVAAFPLEALFAMSAGGLWFALWQKSWRWLGVPIIALGFIVALRTHQPDMIIADDGSNVAIRKSDGQFYLLSSRRGRFESEMWLRADGDARTPKEAAIRNQGFVCDPVGCKARFGDRDQKQIVVAFREEALVEDCSSGGILIDLSKGQPQPCATPELTVTRAVLAREGAISIQLNSDRITWTSVERVRGKRPWSRRAVVQ